MDALENTHVESHRPRRWAVSTGALLLFVLTLTLPLPSAGAAATAPDTASEVAATAGTVAEPVAAPPSSAATAPPSAPAPSPPPASVPVPVPAPSPAPVDKPTTDVIDRSLDSGGSTIPQVVREPAHQAAAAVDAVAEDGSVSHVPIVEDAARHGGEVASSSLGTVAAGTGTSGAPQHSRSPITDGPRSPAKEDTGPAPRSDLVGPPSPPPARSALLWVIPQAELDLTAPGDTSFFTRILDLPGGTAALTSTLPGDDAGRGTAGSPNAPSLPSPIGTAASSPLGGGFGSFVLLLGLLAVFARAAPKTPPGLLTAAVRYRPDPFICALERPG
jgi:hypothetical protein